MMVPRARVDGLLVENLEDEVLLYDLEEHRAHCLNRTAALVWRRCDGARNIAELAEALSREAEVPDDEEVVVLALEGLWQAGLLLEEPPRPPARCTRRTVARRLGMTTALAALLPLVSSITAPTAAQAASLLSPGASHPVPGGGEDDEGPELLPLVGLVPGVGFIATGFARRRRRRRRRSDEVIQK